MVRAVRAGVFYFLLLYGLGWLLGPIRQLLVAPHVGEIAALAIEAPLMIAGMVLASRYLIDRIRVSRALAPRLVMGLTALGLLFVAEYAAFNMIEGWTVAQYVAHFSTLPGQVSLLLYALFAAMPVILAARA